MNDKLSPLAKMISGPHGALATLMVEGDGPGLLWLGGYASDMRGTKAEAIDAHARARGLPYCRFDYSGHGESDGDFEDGTISRWAEDARHILTTQTKGPQILIGSSMGAWIAGLLARQHPERLAGLILIAPAPDFATELTPHQWPQDQWATLQKEGRIAIPSEFDDSEMVYTKAMFDDGAKNKVFDQPLSVPSPVRVLTGMKDDVVPWQHAVRYAEHIDSPDVTVTLAKEGDHRLSSPDDLTRLMATIDELTR
ncbi:MAG: alpha/beta hydrolase [Pseudomonadota bacterium]